MKKKPDCMCVIHLKQDDDKSAKCYCKDVNCPCYKGNVLKPGVSLKSS